MKEIYVVIDSTFRSVSILDKKTFDKFIKEGSLEDSELLICSTERSFIIENRTLKKSRYKFTLIP